MASVNFVVIVKGDDRSGRAFSDSSALEKSSYEIGHISMWRTGPGGVFEQWKKIAEGASGWRRVNDASASKVPQVSPREFSSVLSSLPQRDLHRMLDARADYYSASPDNLAEENHAHGLMAQHGIHPAHAGQFLEREDLKNATEEVVDQKHDPIEAFHREGFPSEKQLVSEFGGKKIGEGGSGRVYFLEKPEPMVVKFGKIPEKEYEFAHKVAELGIAPEVYGYDARSKEEDRAMYMEHLEDYERFHNLPDEDRREAIPAFLSSLKKMHSNGIAHGDLDNQSNIMVSPDGSDVKLVDFMWASSDPMAVSSEVSELSRKLPKMFAPFDKETSFELVRLNREMGGRTFLDMNMTEEGKKQYVHQFYNRLGEVLEEKGYSLSKSFVLSKGQGADLGDSREWRTGSNGSLETWHKVAEGPGGWERKSPEKGVHPTNVPQMNRAYFQAILKDINDDHLQEFVSASRSRALSERQGDNYWEQESAHDLRNMLDHRFDLHEEHIHPVAHGSEFCRVAEDEQRQRWEESLVDPEDEDAVREAYNVPPDWALLGSGNWANVYFDKGPPPTAVKVIRTQEEGAGRDNQDEYEIGKTMGEMGVGPEVFDYEPGDRRESDPFFTKLHMEFLDGFKTFSKYASEHSPEENRSANFKALDALEKMHREGYAHLDLVPCNLMVHPETGDVKLIDFGFAKGSNRSSWNEISRQDSFHEILHNALDEGTYDEIRDRIKVMDNHYRQEAALPENSVLGQNEKVAKKYIDRFYEFLNENRIDKSQNLQSGFVVLCKGSSYPLGYKATWRTGPRGAPELWEKVAIGPHGWKRVSSGTETYSYDSPEWSHQHVSHILSYHDRADREKLDAMLAVHDLVKERGGDTAAGQIREGIANHLEERGMMFPPVVQHLREDGLAVEDVRRALKDSSEEERHVERLEGKELARILRRARGRHLSAEKSFRQLTSNQQKTRTVATDDIKVGNGQAKRQPKGLAKRTEGIDGASMIMRSRQIGHKLTGHYADKGMFGQIVSSHAEKLVAKYHSQQSEIRSSPSGASKPIGVSRESCGDCRKWFRADAVKFGNTHVVADPKFTRIYYPNGSVDVFDRHNELVRRVSPRENPEVTQFGYRGKVW